MKSLNEWLKDREEIQSEALTDGRDSMWSHWKPKAWLPWKKKTDGGEDENPVRQAMSNEPKNKLKQLQGKPGQFAKCPYCNSGIDSFYDNRCWRCQKEFWLDDEQQQLAKRVVVNQNAKSRGMTHYTHNGELLHTDPKGAARAERRNREGIRDDLSNI